MQEYILDRKMAKRGNCAVTKVLVKWGSSDPKSATWKFLFDLQAKYLKCTLKDKGAYEGEDLMCGIQGAGSHAPEETEQT